ncbi:hypothetical protein K0B96_06580 [Horticoccus luteus]|uniref:Uncharacterized protein n=1 Tax=Horticoccus luteus TaxID=2862869 RepID=A0A8F9XID1_9BACT|nr:hypothetical protein [Horticoccus luteus]QYM80275.1 hypothetical protein K0B96_06580 [Horticoccus luteus]
MIPLFAQTTPSPAAVASFVNVVEVAAWLAVAFAAVVVAWRQMTGKSEETRISPSPLEVKQHARLAKWEELETVKAEAHGRISRERKEIDAAIVRVEQQQRALGLRIDDDLREIRDAMQANNEAAEKRVERINARLDNLNTVVTDLPGRIVGLIDGAKHL